MPEDHDLYMRLRAEAPRNVEYLDSLGYGWNAEFGWFEKPDLESTVSTIDIDEARKPFPALVDFAGAGGTIRPIRSKRP